jgi:hypothetical protein
MKTIHLFLGALACAGVGAATATLGSPVKVPAAQEAGLSARGPAEAAGGSVLEGGLAKLNERMDLLESELASLRLAGQREAVPASSAASGAAGTAPPAGALAVDPKLRDQILRVVEDQRLEEQRLREEERKRREEQQVLRRAERVAKELSMTPAEERRLADVMFAANLRRDEIVTEMRDMGFDRDVARERFQEFRTWGQGELDKNFGANLAKQITESDPGILGVGFGGRRQGDGGFLGQGAGFGAVAPQAAPNPGGTSPQFIYEIK